MVQKHNSLFNDGNKNTIKRYNSTQQCMENAPLHGIGC